MDVSAVCITSTCSAIAALPPQSYINYMGLVPSTHFPSHFPPLPQQSGFAVTAVALFNFSRPIGCLMINWTAGLRL